MAYSSLSDLRTARDTRLASTDYIFLSDNNDRFDPIYLELIRTYREALRNITVKVTESKEDAENTDFRQDGSSLIFIEDVELPDEPVMV